MTDSEDRGMQLTTNRKNLVNACALKCLNKELYARGMIPSELYHAAAEKILLEIDRQNTLLRNEMPIVTRRFG